MEKLYRDRPELIGSYNLLACLTRRFSRVLLTLGGVDVSDSNTIHDFTFRRLVSSRMYRWPSAGDMRSGFSVTGLVNEWGFDVDSQEQCQVVVNTVTGLLAAFEEDGAGTTRETTPNVGTADIDPTHRQRNADEPVGQGCEKVVRSNECGTVAVLLFRSPSAQNPTSTPPVPTPKYSAAFEPRHGRLWLPHSGKSWTAWSPQLHRLVQELLPAPLYRLRV